MPRSHGRRKQTEVDVHLLRRQLHCSCRHTILKACEAAGRLPQTSLWELRSELAIVAERHDAEIKRTARAALASSGSMSAQVTAEQCVRGPLTGIAAMRVGNGQALQPALLEGRFVQAVSWYITSMGKPLVKHSLLKITVADKYGIQGPCYVLEKTGDYNATHGVEVSYWSSSVPDVEDWFGLLPGEVEYGLTVKELYNEAVKLGPYHVLGNNCHHTARAVIKHCRAKGIRRVRRIPNESLIAIGESLGAYVGYAGQSMSSTSSLLGTLPQSCTQNSCSAKPSRSNTGGCVAM